MEHEMHDHDRGLAFDLSTLFQRRRMLGLFGAAGLATGLATLAGCTTSSDGPTTATTADCSIKIPQETAGPYPGDMKTSHPPETDADPSRPVSAAALDRRAQKCHSK